MSGTPSTPKQFLEAQLAGVRLAQDLAKLTGQKVFPVEALPIEEFTENGRPTAVLVYMRGLSDGSRLLVTMRASVDNSPVCGPLRPEGVH